MANPTITFFTPRPVRGRISGNIVLCAASQNDTSQIERVFRRCHQIAVQPFAGATSLESCYWVTWRQSTAHLNGQLITGGLCSTEMSLASGDATSGFHGDNYAVALSALTFTAFGDT